MAVANKIYSQGSRVLQKRNSTQNVIFNDADILFNGSNNVITANQRYWTFNFHYNFDWIASNFNVGGNTNIIRVDYNASSVIKNMTRNEDNNGNIANSTEYFDNNSFYLPVNQHHLLTKISTSKSSGQIRPIYFIKFNTAFMNLIEIDFINGGFINDFSFISNCPALKILKTTVSTSLTNYNALKTNNTIKYLYIGDERTFSLSDAPESLEFLRISKSSFGSLTIDLKDFFTGNRKGIQLATFGGTITITYSGGAVFPSIISEDIGYKIDYIFFQASSVTNKLNGTDFARFIVDFANQVTSVTLTNKRIVASGTTPNTSYTDNSQPLFKTYASALNHITSTLGITVTFT